MFALLPDVPATQVAVYIEGTAVMVPKGVSAAAAMLMASDAATRTTPVSGEPRAPYCMMGVCFECLAAIDGVPNQQACLVPVAEGMRIDRQDGGVEVKL